jgi:hypothetical protein
MSSSTSASSTNNAPQLVPSTLISYLMHSWSIDQVKEFLDYLGMMDISLATKIVQEKIDGNALIN